MKQRIMNFLVIKDGSVLYEGKNVTMQSLLAAFELYHSSASSIVVTFEDVEIKMPEK